MKNAASYIAQARNTANRRHYNFVDDSRMNFVQQPGFNATGPSASVKKSQPYIVIVSSASGAAVANFDVLGANEYVTNPGMTAGGSLVIGLITISSGIPNITYRDFLYQSQQQPFTVGMTYLECANAVAQVNQVFTIKTKDANGIQLDIPIVPAIDPYQQQTGINIVNQEYRIDGNTKLTFSSILAGAIFVIRFYPSDNIAPQRALSGQATVNQYGNPGVIR